MQVKVIHADSYHEGEEMLNAFLKGKKSIIDIKMQVNYVGDEDHYAFLVMYD